jgi:hypothetical protein
VIFFSLKNVIFFLQIKALQTNHFISHLLEVLAEDSGSFREDTTIATSATNDTGCHSCTISSYDSEEDESKDQNSLSYCCNTHTSDLGGCCEAAGSYMSSGGQPQRQTTRSDSPQQQQDYESNRVLLCPNHLGKNDEKLNMDIYTKVHRRTRH